MAIIGNRNGNGGGISAGTYVIVLNNIYDLGLQAPPPGAAQKGEKPKYKRAYCFHLLDEDNGGRIHRISAIVTDSMGEKSRLREVVRALRGGKEFTGEEMRAGGYDDKTILGKSCMGVIGVDTSSGKQKSSIVSYAPLARGMTPLKPEPEPLAPPWVVTMQAARMDVDKECVEVKAVEPPPAEVKTPAPKAPCATPAAITDWDPNEDYGAETE